MCKKLLLLLVASIAFPVAAGAATVQLPQTGQKTCYSEAGELLPTCAGTGQDGELQTGVAWPSPRFTVNMQADGVTPDGTVTDELTGLTWLTNTTCLAPTDWADALRLANELSTGECGLADGSNAGDWRLPNVVEMESLIDISRTLPALPEGHPFSAPDGSYWTSTTHGHFPNLAWGVNIYDGNVRGAPKDTTTDYRVLPVRGGQLPTE
ncbi:DUF1566 domain-containing protein [Geobacter sp. DSM 9736]|uniref:Lcl C-terminal domain-containing protein n=1 Tax=Geobacter sp. DSM 9736 TaxID=1277350 RepID=UPI000B511DFC|nr:DUF1566 domain-containing protein [Geobacter sp. DSM 9736]SNB46049.1 Protein of unknown function [Geobacter sp. DSM 9736]